MRPGICRRILLGSAFAVVILASAVLASTTLDFSTLTSLSTLPTGWSTGGNSSLLSLKAGCQAPFGNGTQGLQYSSSNDTAGYLTYALPVSKSSVSVGMAYKTGASYQWVEGPHFLASGSWSYGDMNRAADERNSYDNEREIRISPAANTATGARVGVTDNTWYWVTMKFTVGSPTVMNIYDSSLLLVGTATYTTGTPTKIDYINIGNDQGGSNQSFVTCMDHFMIDDQTAVFPLMPGTTAPLSIATMSIPSGEINVAYTTTTLAATGGKTPYTWTITGLPGGLTSNSGGQISGTPTVLGTFTVTATVTDSSSPQKQAAQTYALTVASQPTVHTGAYTTTGGYSANVTSESTDKTMWFGTVAVGGISVPTFWNVNGVSQTAVLTLVLH
jgi:hypothetical protein